MFLDLSLYEPRGEPQPPEPKPKRLTRRQEKVLLAAIFFNLLVALLAPIGGSTILEGALFLFR